MRWETLFRVLLSAPDREISRGISLRRSGGNRSLVLTSWGVPCSWSCLVPVCSSYLYCSVVSLFILTRFDSLFRVCGVDVLRFLVCLVISTGLNTLVVDRSWEVQVVPVVVGQRSVMENEWWLETRS